MEGIGYGGYINPFVNIVGRVVVMYVSGYPLDGDELEAYAKLLKELPPRPDCGVMLHKWSDFYPTVQANGIMIGLRDRTKVVSEEVLIPYAEFDMRNVPWDKLNPINPVLGLV